MAQKFLKMRCNVFRISGVQAIYFESFESFQGIRIAFVFYWEKKHKFSLMYELATRWHTDPFFCVSNPDDGLKEVTSGVGKPQDQLTVG